MFFFRVFQFRNTCNLDLKTRKALNLKAVVPNTEKPHAQNFALVFDPKRQTRNGCVIQVGPAATAETMSQGQGFVGPGV